MGCSLGYRISYRNNIARRFQYFVTSNLPIVLVNCMIVDFAKNLDVFLKYKHITILAYMLILFCFVCLFVCLRFLSLLQLRKAREDFHKEKHKIPRPGFKPGLS